MAGEPEFRGRNILQYLLYIVLIGIFLVAIIYLLFHARATEAPKVTNGVTRSFVALPLSACWQG